LVEENGWSIFNGCMKGDEEGEFTFTGGRGNTIIDFVIGEEEARERIERLTIGDRIDSNHHPLEVWMKGGGVRRVMERREKKVWKGLWDTEGRERFKQKMGSIEIMEGSVEEHWKAVSGRVKSTLKEIEEEREREAGGKRQKSWWDVECREEKRKVRRKLREWKRRDLEEEEIKTREGDRKRKIKICICRTNSKMEVISHQ